MSHVRGWEMLEAYVWSGAKDTMYQNMDLCTFALNLAAIRLFTCCRFCANIRSQLFYGQCMGHTEPDDIEFKIRTRWLCSISWPQATLWVQLAVSGVGNVATGAPNQKFQLDGSCGLIYCCCGSGRSVPSQPGGGSGWSVFDLMPSELILLLWTQGFCVC